MYSLLSSYFVIPEVVLPGSTIALYADDCKCSRIIDTVGDLDLLQHDLDNLHQWSVWNFMSFNVKKCKITKITKKTQPLISSFSLDNSGLEEVEEFKDLGIFTNQHLSWNPHIYYVVSKANSVLGLIKRTCKGLDDLTTLHFPYITALWFARTWNTVWWCGSGGGSGSGSGPRIQKEILINWKGYREEQQNDPYDIRLKRLNLMSLHKRRLLTDVTFSYKVLNGNINIDVSKIIDFQSEADRFSLTKVQGLFNVKKEICQNLCPEAGALNENIVQNHLNIALLNLF